MEDKLIGILLTLSKILDANESPGIIDGRTVNHYTDGPYIVGMVTLNISFQGYDISMDRQHVEKESGDGYDVINYVKINNIPVSQIDEGNYHAVISEMVDIILGVKTDYNEGKL